MFIWRIFWFNWNLNYIILGGIFSKFSQLNLTFSPEDGDSKFLQKTGIYLQVLMVSNLRTAISIVVNLFGDQNWFLLYTNTEGKPTTNWDELNSRNFVILYKGKCPIIILCISWKHRHILTDTPRQNWKALEDCIHSVSITMYYVINPCIVTHRIMDVDLCIHCF